MIYEWRDVRDDGTVLISWGQPSLDLPGPWLPYGHWADRPIGQWKRQVKIDGEWVTRMRLAHDGHSWAAQRVHPPDPPVK